MKTALPIITLLCSGLILSACHKSPEQETTKTDPQNKVEQQLDTIPIKEFPATEQDTQDIEILVNFNNQFSALSDEMENEIIKMQQDGSLTPEFELSRRQDNIQSAFNMLKELDLHTEQGRYIQGLLYSSWEAQQKQLKENSSVEAKQPVQGINEYMQAQKQLQHWKNQTEKKS